MSLQNPLNGKSKAAAEGPRYPDCRLDPVHGCFGCRTFDKALLRSMGECLASMPAPLVIKDPKTGESVKVVLVRADLVEIWQQHLKIVSGHLVGKTAAEPVGQLLA